MFDDGHTMLPQSTRPETDIHPVDVGRAGDLRDAQSLPRGSKGPRIRRNWSVAAAAGAILVGTGVWTLEQHGDTVDVRYDWRIRADKALLRYGTPIFRPIFGANHRWAMARGEESLRLELMRRRAKTEAERLAVPAPPRPTFARTPR